MMEQNIKNVFILYSAVQFESKTTEIRMVTSASVFCEEKARVKKPDEGRARLATLRNAVEPGGVLAAFSDAAVRTSFQRE
jgi:hypothetical protein